MAKLQELYFVCEQCGEEHLRWQGQCGNCKAWNTLKEFRAPKSTRQLANQTTSQPITAVEFSKIKVADFKPIESGIGEFDRVLGAGIIPGSVILLGGDPGIGKSTLVLQLAEVIEGALYVSGEESKEQVGLRAKRLGLSLSKASFIAETNLAAILAHLRVSGKLPRLLVIDSIQTMYHPEFPSTPGSIVQVRESAMRLQQFAKTTGVSVILVGHVTKEGTVAGPRTLEHLVDVVLYLEGDHEHEHRVLRGVKNRFGAATEVGIFRMTATGLESVSNPSELFLKERVATVPGSVVTATIEGRRALLVEIQALATKSGFGYPRRTASGFDINRLLLLLAVLSERAGIRAESLDIYLNVVGGFTLREPAADLAVLLAAASAIKHTALPAKLCAWGEVGLSGELRSVPHQEVRAKEAKVLGYIPVIKSRTLSELLAKVVS